LKNLINEILELVDISHGEIRSSLKGYSLNKILRDCISTVQPLSVKKHIKIINNIDLTTNHTIHVDDTLFRKVIINILSNAIKYNSPDGIVMLTCNTTGNHKLNISIRDTGIGISEKDKQFIFKPFERAANYQGVDGAGIGLTTSKYLIEIMNGSIGFESEPGKGSNFFIQIPLA